MHINPWHEISHDPMALLGMIMLAIILFMAIFAPLLSGYSPDDYTGQIFSPPSMDHLLGTDSMGQDIWARLLFGARTSLAVAAFVALISSAFSVFIGASAALAGGLYERFWMRTVDAHDLTSHHNCDDSGGSVPSAQPASLNHTNIRLLLARRSEDRSFPGSYPEREDAYLCRPDLWSGPEAHTQKPHNS